MNLPTRDRIATALVAAATLIAVLWLAGALGGVSAGAVAVVVLALGFVASALAVVPGFAALLAGSRWYLAAASAGGVVALVAGVATVIEPSDVTLTILVVATIALWAAATARHVGAESRGGRAAHG